VTPDSLCQDYQQSGHINKVVISTSSSYLGETAGVIINWGDAPHTGFGFLTYLVRMLLGSRFIADLNFLCDNSLGFCTVTILGQRTMTT